MWNKKGQSDKTVGLMIEIVIGLVILILLVAFVLVPKIKDWAKNTDTYQGCSVFNNKGGCVNEADKLIKEDSGFLCFNDTGGCKNDISWCCYGTS